MYKKCWDVAPVVSRERIGVFGFLVCKFRRNRLGGRLGYYVYKYFADNDERCTAEANGNMFFLRVGGCKALRFFHQGSAQICGVEIGCHCS